MKVADRRTVLALCAALLAAAAAHAQTTSSELRPTPPPEHASEAEVIAHVLAEQVGTWWRDAPAAERAPAQIEGLRAQTEALTLYRARCGAQTRYREADSGIAADVILLGFPSYLDALGFFSAQRTQQARRVLLTSSAYREDGVLHAWSGQWYLRVHAPDAETKGLPADQQLAARLEVRLPIVPEDEVPRLISLLPRRWITSLSLSYRPTKLLGDSARPMALCVEHEIGLRRVSIEVIDARDDAQARRWYTAILSGVIERTGAFAIDGLGQEGFGARLDSGWSVGVVQDQFIACVSGAPERSDAEALARLVGVAIRTSRPLPHFPPDEDAAVDQRGD